MNTYQLTIHLNPQLKKESIKETKEELKERLKENEGQIIRTNDLKKTKLTFPIEDFQESFLWDLTVELPPSKIGKVQNELKEKDEILRLMVTKKPKSEIQKSQTSSKQEQKKETESTKPKEKTTKKEEG